MDKSQIIALSINILKSTPGTLATDIQVPKVDPCSLCGEEFLSDSSGPIKEFTLASCGHIFHQKCLEKHLVNSEAICPNKECGKVIETSLSADLSKEVRLYESTKPPAEETNTSELTSTTATTVAITKQVDSDQTPVDDVDDPLESERHIEVQLTGSTKVSLDKTQAMDVDKGEEEEEQSVVDQEIDVDNVGGEDEVEVQVNPDTASKKRANASTDKPSSKKAKTKVEDSRTLKKLIRELSIGAPKVSEVREKESLFKLTQQGKDGSTRVFLTLYCKITNAEAGHENSNQEVIRCYYYFGEALSRRLDFHKKTKEEHEAQKLVNDEVRDQLPKEVPKTTLWKKTERARKIYDLFRRIGSDKIQRVRSFTVSSITKLSWDKIDYVVSQISKNTA